PVAVAPSDAQTNDRPQSVLQALGGRAAKDYPDAASLLDDFKPDAVSVGTIFGRNGDLVAMALQRNIPVVSDKPIATTREQLDRGGTGIVHADYFRPEKTPTHGDDRLRVAGTKGIVEVRAGCCTLLGENGVELDITDSVEVRPMHEELLAALRGEANDLFNT